MLVGVVFWPVLRIVHASVTDPDDGFVGLRHFRATLQAEGAWSVFGRTLLWALVVPAVVTALGDDEAADLVEPGVRRDHADRRVAEGGRRGRRDVLDAVARADADERERLRELAVAIFDDLGQEDPRATAYRRRLASALY